VPFFLAIFAEILTGSASPNAFTFCGDGHKIAACIK